MGSESESRLCRILEELYIRSCEQKAEAVKLSRNAVDFMNGREAGLQKDIKICLIKGGTYKIKGYYLENNELSDIRGASAIITRVQEEIIPQLIIGTIGFDCILYNGGGNLFAVVPEDTDPAFGEALEAEAQKYLVTANSAYCVSEPMLLSELLGKDYRIRIAEKENELEQRKKLKISFDAAPRSGFAGKDIFGIPINASETDEGAYCEKCRKRIARYKTKDINICGGCLHKYFVGLEQKSDYAQEYKSYLKNIGASADNVNTAHTLSDISGDRIAVIYADGNNMGGIIQNFTKLTDMMDFSSFVKNTMPQVVYSSMHKCGIDSFETVALGGDDIFMIIPGKKAVSFSLALIKEYNKRFGEKYGEGVSTLSVGASIAKTNTPVKVMLEEAEEKLAEAKEKEKAESCGGSLSYVILNSSQVNTGKAESMLPFSAEETEAVLDYVNTIKRNSVAGSKLRNIAEAYETAESFEDANLFFAYMNAKEDKPDKRISLPEIQGYRINGGCYEKDGRIYTLWNELLDLAGL